MFVYQCPPAHLSVLFYTAQNAKDADHLRAVGRKVSLPRELAKMVRPDGADKDDSFSLLRAFQGLSFSPAIFTGSKPTKTPTAADAEPCRVMWPLRNTDPTRTRTRLRCDDDFRCNKPFKSFVFLITLLFLLFVLWMCHSRTTLQQELWHIPAFQTSYFQQTSGNLFLLIWFYVLWVLFMIVINEFWRFTRLSSSLNEII